MPILPPQPPLPLPPPVRVRRPRHTPDWRVPGYGVGYNPAWPSILSVAHDEADGGRLFVVTDRPCVLLGSAAGLPIAVAGLSVLDCVEVLPVKFALAMSGAVPQGSAWTWGPAAGNDLVDP